MDKILVRKYYSRPEIEKAILSFAKDREIGVMFDGFFGKRPDIIEYVSDIRILVRKGVFSFHCSEERWANPLLLGNDKLSQDEKNKNRTGWDLILDLDGVDFIYSKLFAKVILDYFDKIGIRNVTIKFSGNKGFHIGIPFEAFPPEAPGLVSGISQTRLLFPDMAKKTVLFLIHELKSRISKVILNYEGGGIKAIKLICERYSIPQKSLEYNEKKNEFNFMKVIDIDTILITSRHLFRMPYSLNEKSGLVSVPVDKDKVMEFEKDMAKPQLVNPSSNKEFEFLRYDSLYGQDGRVLLEKVYSDEDYMYDSMNLEYENSLKGSRDSFAFEITEEVKVSDFPRTIQYVLGNKFEDGRKRALFLLMTFLTSVKWDIETVEQVVREWNDKQSNPLKSNYLMAQMSWFKAQSKVLCPPNFSNANYYFGIGIPQEIVDDDVNKFVNRKSKNPLHYVYLKLKSKVRRN